MFKASFISGFLLSTNSAVLVPESYLEDITYYIKDIDNISQEEIECIRMVYPYVKMKGE